MQTKNLHLHEVRPPTPYTFIATISDVAVSENVKCEKITKLLAANPQLHKQPLVMFGRATGLHIAATQNLLEISKLLLSMGADINAIDDNHSTVLHFAAEYDGMEMIYFLYYYRDYVMPDFQPINLNAQDILRETALHRAVKLKNLITVKALLQTEIDRSLVNSNGKTAQDLIYDIPDVVIKVKMAQLFNINLFHCAPLHFAIINNLSTEEVKMHLDFGACVNVVDDNQYTPLHYAAELGLGNIILLLTYHPSIKMDLVDKLGETALHKCVKYKHTKCAKALMTAVQPINYRIRNHHCQTAKGLIENIDDENIKLQMLDAISSKPIASHLKQSSSEELQKLSIDLHKFNMLKIKYKELNLVIPEPLSNHETNIEKRLRLENKTFEREFIIEFNKGLNSPEVSKLNDEYIASLDGDKLEIQAIQAIYYILTQQPQLLVDITRRFQIAIGLFSMYPPIHIMKAINSLSSMMNYTEMMIAHNLIKEILLLCFDCRYPLKNSNIQEQLNIFILRFKHSELCENLQNIFNLVKNTQPYHPRSEIKSSLSSPQDNIINKIKEVSNSLSLISSTDLPKYFANECVNLTAYYFKIIPINEYVSNHLPEKAAFNELSMLQDKYRQLIFDSILNQKNIKLRAKLISFYIHAAKECLSHPIAPDLFSMMAIIAVINDSKIADLTDTMALIDKTTINILKHLSNIMQSDASVNYYEFLIAYGLILPALHILKKRIIHIDEREQLSCQKIMGMGCMLEQIVALKKKYRDIEFINKSNLFTYLQDLPKEPKENYQDLSSALQPNIIDLATATGEIVLTALNRLNINQIPLYIKDEKTGKVYTEVKAISHIEKWLKKKSDSEIDAQLAEKIRNCCNDSTKSAPVEKSKSVKFFPENSPPKKRSTLKEGFYEQFRK